MKPQACPARGRAEKSPDEREARLVLATPIRLRCASLRVTMGAGAAHGWMKGGSLKAERSGGLGMAGTVRAMDNPRPDSMRVRLDSCLRRNDRVVSRGREKA